MRVVVIEGPKPILSPKDVPGEHTGDDVFVTTLIAAAQSRIDGPTGWLGRALGEQTIEVRHRGWPKRLPYHPVIDIVSVHIDGEAVIGTRASWDGLLDPVSGVDGLEVVIRYRAGYDGADTGTVPHSAKAAVMLGVNLLRSTAEGDVFLTQDQVNGIGSTTRNVTPYVAETIDNAVKSLVWPLKVFS